MRATTRAAITEVQHTGIASCGHPNLPQKPIWLRTEKAGSVLEVWSVCPTCHNHNDYLWDGHGEPYRIRREVLP